MTRRYPYLLKGKHAYPLADVELVGPRASIVVKALVDSGAALSVFRKEIAEFVGIDVESGKPLHLEGIGGRILGYLHWVEVRICDVGFLGKIVFSKQLLVPVNIMGRDNLFEPFLITFREKRHFLEITPIKK